MRGAADRSSSSILSGFDFVFSEEDSPRREIETLQYLIAVKFSEISRDNENGVLFVFASSEKECPHLLNFSNVAIEIYQRQKWNRKRKIRAQIY